MHLGLPWWAVQLMAHIFEGYEALPGIDWNSKHDAAIVDPVQAAFGIITFKVLEYFRVCEATFSYPKNSVPQFNAAWFNWALKCALPGIPLFLGATLTPVFGWHNDWIWTIAISVAASFTWWFSQNCGKWRSYLQFVYPIGFSGSVLIANRIPYSPWLLSIWVHSPVVITGIAIIIYNYRLALLAERNETTSTTATTSETKVGLKITDAEVRENAKEVTEIV